MRINRLDLLRYGHFTDSPIKLPSTNPDLHILYGPNEAGKSTALASIEDLLFGIPQTSPFNFIHDYSAMRIGAVLEHETLSIEIRRRKGRKDTLLDANDVPSPAGESTLARFLAGASLDFFKRMFCMDQVRLREGGREILEAKGEVGQMLFAAGSGIAGFKDILVAFDGQADSLWAPRRAEHRRFYQIQDRLKEADGLIREHLVTAKKWEDLKKAYEEAEQKCLDLDNQIESKSIDQRKLSRIRRVYRNVQRKIEIDNELAALGDVEMLPDDANETFETAGRDLADAKTRIDTLTEQLVVIENDRKSLDFDEALLLREEDIKALHEWRIKILASRSDLPKRRVELLAAETELQGLAGEVEWTSDDIANLVERIPPRTKVKAVRALLTRRGERLTSQKSAKTALNEAEAKVEDLRKKLDNAVRPVDVSTLSAVIKATREIGDITSRVALAEGTTEDLEATILARIDHLVPLVKDEKILLDLKIPPLDTVTAHREAVREMVRRRQTCVDSIHSAEQEIERQQKAYDRTTKNENAVSLEELERSRTRRDSGWSLVRKRYVDNEEVSEQDVLEFTGDEVNLADSFASTIVCADQVADRRFDNAEAAARLTVITEKIAEQQIQLEQLIEEQSAIEDLSLKLEADWLAMWSEADLSPLLPDAMLEWMTERDEILRLIEQRNKSKRQLDTLRDEESKGKQVLLSEMEAVGNDSSSVKNHEIRVVLEVAAELERTNAQREESLCQIEETLGIAENDTERKRKALHEAEVEWADWERQWQEAVAAVGLDEAADVEVISVQLDVFDKMREKEIKISELRHERIEKIERDISAFELAVKKVVDGVASELSEKNPDDAILEIERRLEEARSLRSQQQQKSKDIESLREKIKEGQESQKSAHETLDRLQQLAKVESIDDLESAIERSDTMRALRSDFVTVTDTMVKDGDGLAVSELQTECADVDIDEIATREQSTQAELKELQTLLIDAKGELTKCKQEFDAVGGGDVVAQAEAKRQEALTEMQAVAENYVRVRSSASVLKWAIDRFRREKQAPLLIRAGQFFATLTNGSFTSLMVEYDEQDKMHLAGVRQDGKTVRTEGLSTGTADQLYLALRIASVEDYLARATPLPFIVDDLFIHFDDDRAAAGFKVLSELSKKTQVLFFTHHKHLPALARKTLGENTSVIDI